MALGFDEFPVDDDILDSSGQTKFSNVWRGSISSFYQNLIGYLTDTGIFIPQITINMRNKISAPIEGQIIYVVDGIAGPPRTGQLQMWQVVADIGQWTVII